MSELNISLILERYKNKREYISCEKVTKEERESCINDHLVPDKKIGC